MPTNTLSVATDEFGLGIWLKLPGITLRVRAPDNLTEIYEARLHRHKRDIYIEISTNYGEDVLDIREWCGNLGVDFKCVSELLGDDLTLERGLSNG